MLRNFSPNSESGGKEGAADRTGWGEEAEGMSLNALRPTLWVHTRARTLKMLKFTWEALGGLWETPKLYQPQSQYRIEDAC